MNGDPINPSHPSTAGPRTAEQRAGFKVYRSADGLRFSLRANAEQSELIGDALGWPLGARIGDIVGENDCWSIKLGPDEWQLHGLEAAAPALVKASRTLYPKCPHALVDIGHRDVGFIVEGAGAVQAIQTVCPLDIGNWPVKRGARTIFDRVGILLIRTGPERFQIECWRSLAGHLEALFCAIEQDLALDDSFGSQ